MRRDYTRGCAWWVNEGNNDDPRCDVNEWQGQGMGAKPIPGVQYGIGAGPGGPITWVASHRRRRGYGRASGYTYKVWVHE